jgi:sec-independent protein translocase protein TatC
MLPLGFGLAFQLPLVMLFLQRLGIMSIEIYLSKWRIAVLVMACLAAVLSPGGDPYSMMFMFVPLVGLYFLGVGLCRYMPRKTDTDEEMMQSMA